jgi:hypothetical protein
MMTSEMEYIYLISLLINMSADTDIHIHIFSGYKLV